MLTIQKNVGCVSVVHVDTGFEFVRFHKKETEMMVGDYSDTPIKEFVAHQKINLGEFMLACEEAFNLAKNL